MPQGAPARKEKKKPKKDAAVKGVRSTLADETAAPAVEVVGKRRKPRGEERVTAPRSRPAAPQRRLPRRGTPSTPSWRSSPATARQGRGRRSAPPPAGVAGAALRALRAPGGRRRAAPPARAAGRASGGPGGRPGRPGGPGRRAHARGGRAGLALGRGRAGRPRASEPGGAAGKADRKAARRALFRLSQAGVRPDSRPAPPPPAERERPERVRRALMSAADSEGTRLLYLLIDPPLGSAQLARVIASETLASCASRPSRAAGASSSVTSPPSAPTGSWPWPRSRPPTPAG